MDELDLLKQKAEAYDDLRAQLDAIRAERDEAVRWKKAVEDACVLDWVEIKEPAETIQKLILWNIKQALDPQISKEAAEIHNNLNEAVSAIEKIAAGSGVYGQQAAKYKEIAKTALSNIRKVQS